ncbi:uncharacterized protein K441DRAFT_169356 [Cenococcum geophilum 1.58]|uniref:uncharacterized protein n=1 Tax=Cenococcum geophilum 1.58 TaxID=794803 RepID=UPI00358ED592|nr:hypothetical protein K441DRAFT_169356 [Cenococcum geophilum 1.58]
MGPRDKLYAMLRLLPPEDQANALLQPDYNFSMKEVYKQLVNYTISKYRNLDILSYAGIRDSRTEIQACYSINSIQLRP